MNTTTRICVILLVGMLSDATSGEADVLSSKQIENILAHQRSQNVSLKAGDCWIEFDHNARPVRMTKAGGENLFVANQLNDGFVVFGKTPGSTDDPEPYRLERLARDGKWLVAACDQVIVVFEVQEKDHYLTLNLVQLKQLDGFQLYSLQFEFKSNEEFKFWPLDPMTQSRRHGSLHTLSWKWLWARNDKNPFGKVALGLPRDDHDHDEILLKIWVHEGLPHPKVDNPWTEQSAREWLANWQQKFADSSTMVVQPTNNHELYELVQLAQRLGMKNIYLHTDTWRGEYWPHEHSYVNVNRSIFPEGQPSLKKFADHLEEKGLGIALHMVSGSIAPNDPDYVLSGLDEGLAGWVDGKLEQDFTASSKTILFRPNRPTVIPKLVSYNKIGPNTFPNWMNLDCFQVGNELVVAGKYQVRDDGIWELQHLNRLHKSKTQTRIAKGAMVRGLLRPYAQVLTADVDSDLLKEIARRYAGFCNRNNINHLECDALEIHLSKPWGPGKFSWLLYQHMEQPCTSNTSNGRPLPFHIEYWFNSSQHVVRNRPQGGVAGGDGVPLLLHSSYRLATGPYEVHVKPTVAAIRGSKAVNLIRPVPMFGVSKNLVEKHGLSGTVFQTVRDWKQILSKMQSGFDEESILASQQYFLDDRLVSNHPSLAYLLRPATLDGSLAFEPFDVMLAPGKNMPWSWGQEFGPLVPRTYFQVGRGKQILENPFANQEPEVLLRVMSSFEKEDKAIELQQPGKNAEKPDQKTVEQYRTGVDGPAKLKNRNQEKFAEEVNGGDGYVNLMPTNRNKITNRSDQKLALEGQKLIVSASNPASEPLNQIDERPGWNTNLNLQAARGLAIRLTGDNSKALLVVSLGLHLRRDYVIPIDFEGTREFLIPSGEVSWSDSSWGWWPSQRHFDYAKVRGLQVGFGHLPAQSNTKVEIESLRAIFEKPVEVRDLTVQVGQGFLKYDGPLQTGNYVWYTGGDSASVFDLNWQRLKSIPVVRKDFFVKEGKQPVSFSASGASPFIEAQLVVSDDPVAVADTITNH